MADHTAPPAWAAYLILGLMAAFMLIVQSSNGTIVWTMMGEIFPANVRGIMNGTAIFCMWTANAIITWTFPRMMETLGGGGTYTIYGTLNLVIADVCDINCGSEFAKSPIVYIPWEFILFVVIFPTPNRSDIGSSHIIDLNLFVGI